MDLLGSTTTIIERTFGGFRGLYIKNYLSFFLRGPIRIRYRRLTLIFNELDVNLED